ncbi:MAG: metal ABC transporter permease [Rhizobiales bacterium]|nr:metal ABC transporter permease [Hyphomicrobiales bacterium]
MLDDFFVRALVAGIGIALVAGPLGCFIVWRRLSYFGDTLSHAALLGVVLALVLEINITLAVFAVSAIISIVMIALQKRSQISSDALLGLLSHSALALGLLALSFLTWMQVDLMGLLIGDVLSVSKPDIAIIYLGGAAVLAILIAIWRPLFAATVNYELAKAEGQNPDRVNIIFMLLMAMVIAIALKIIGVLLITAMLIIPAAAARRLSAGPEQMAVFASIIGMLSVVMGLYGSLEYDLPSGPAIVVASLGFFLISLLPIAILFKSKKNISKMLGGAK